ncbi:hypothetical protein BLOT_007927 [Blomia tropicalis]|nr:hypothetical protein BLOT_007927 [Blomia tropicalis]
MKTNSYHQQHKHKNVQQSKAGTQRLIINADKLDASMTCIQEPYTFMDRVRGKTGYKAFYQGNETNSGRYHNAEYYTSSTIL